MPKEKTYYYAKLPENFFDDKKIRFLLTQADGNSLVVLYLKILCRSLRNNGALYFDGMLDSIEDEIALEVGSEPEGIKKAMSILKQAHLIEESAEDGNSFVTVPNIDNILQTETDAARRKRRQRDREKEDTAAASDDTHENPFTAYM